MTDESTKHLAGAIQSHRETWQELQAVIATRDKAAEPWVAAIDRAEHALFHCKVEVGTLLAERQSDGAYRAAGLEVDKLTVALALEETNVTAEAISLRRADVITGNVEIEGYAVRPRVANGIEITDAAEFAQQVKDKLPDLLDVLAPRTPSPKIIKDHAATLAQLKISGWRRTKKITATFTPLDAAS